MSRKNELITLIIATVVIAILTVSSLIENGLWRISTLCFIAAAVFLIVGWIQFFKKREQ